MVAWRFFQNRKVIAVSQQARCGFWVDNV